MKSIFYRIISTILILPGGTAFGYAQENKIPDGPVSNTFTNLFKEGNISYSPVNLNSLEKVPPLPTGFVLFNNMAFRVETKAVRTGAHVFFHPAARERACSDALSLAGPPTDIPVLCST